MKNLSLLVVLLYSASLSADISSQLNSCKIIKDNAQRLDCYDALAQKDNLNKKTNTKKTPALDKASAAKNLAATPGVKTQELENVAQQKKNDELFGKPVSEIRKADSLESTIVGSFKGWKKGAIITLANGQKWKVTSKSSGYVKLMNPKVIIEQGFFNSYNMKVEGLNAQAKVKRIK